MATVIIEKWSLVYAKTDPYKSPEQRQACLQGKVYRHPKHRDGKFVVTSRIVEVNKGSVNTKSGNTYVMGAMDPAYRQWVEAHFPDIDPDSPFHPKNDLATYVGQFNR